MSAVAAPSRVLIPPVKGGMYARAAELAEPFDAGKVWEWADLAENGGRWLSTKGSGEAGWYRSSRTPHLRSIMDDLSVGSPVQRVTIKKPAQNGATDVALNWIGYVMKRAPAPMLYVLPTLEMRKRFVVQRLDPMLVETPSLAAIFNALSKRDGGNTEELKDFPGGNLILGGANSAASLAQMSIMYAVLDEVNRYPWEVGGEGDPLFLIDQRTKGFMRRKVLLISSPTVKGHSRISQEYAQSDQRQLWVPCPQCHRYILLRWKHDDDTLGLECSKISGRVWYMCRECGVGIEENRKTAMLAEHSWRPLKPQVQLHHGYTWNSLYTPIGLGYTWRELLDMWHRVQDDSTKLKGFTNTELAEDYEEKSEGIEGATLIARVGVDVPEIPAGNVRAAGTDVQKDRLEMSVYTYVESEEAWAETHVILPGDTADKQVWEDLETACDELGVQVMAVDGSYNTAMVNAFVEKRPWCVAIKGMDGMNRPFIEDERKRKARLRARRRKGVPQEPLGVDTGKAMLYARLRKLQRGPGYIHFQNSEDFDAEFFAQLGAERLVTKAKGGRQFHEWVKDRPRNEALDCALYAWAAYLLRKYMRVRQVAPVAPAQSNEVPAPPQTATRTAAPANRFRGYR